MAVLDSGGKLVSLQRQDGSSMMRPDIAIAKAWGALALGCSSRKLAQDADARPAFISAINVLAHGNMVPVMVVYWFVMNRIWFWVQLGSVAIYQT